MSGRVAASAAPLSPWGALWALARPSMLPHIGLLVGAGYGWAHWDRALSAQHPDRFGWVLVAWAWLHVGSLWLNAAVDQDEGEVLFGRAVPPPRGVELAGYVALMATLVFASLAGPWALGCAAVCVALAVLYSHPRALWKGHPLGGPFVNLVGYGLLSPMAGFAITELPVTTRTLAVWPLGALAVLATYFAAQAFQAEEDGARGYRTLVVTHGPVVVLAAARACVALAIGGGVILCLLGWLPRSCLVTVPAWWALDRWLVRWQRAPGGGDASWARGYTRRLLVVALLGLGAATWDYVRDSLEDAPVAGLGTASGHPPDRPRLSPRAMKLWEAERGRGAW